jgi:hypothetical protein
MTDAPPLKRHPHTKYDGSWWEYDVKGRPLCRVCAECRKAKLSTYRPEIVGSPDGASR